MPLLTKKQKRGITEFRLNRRVTLSEGKLGILEPEK